MRRLLPGAAAVTQGHVVLTQQLQQEAAVRYFRYYRYCHEMYCDRRAPNVQVYYIKSKCQPDKYLQKYQLTSVK